MPPVKYRIVDYYWVPTRKMHWFFADTVTQKAIIDEHLCLEDLAPYNEAGMIGESFSKKNSMARELLTQILVIPKDDSAKGMITDNYVDGEKDTSEPEKTSETRTKGKYRENLKRKSMPCPSGVKTNVSSPRKSRKVQIAQNLNYFHVATNGSNSDDWNLNFNDRNMNQQNSFEEDVSFGKKAMSSYGGLDDDVINEEELTVEGQLQIEEILRSRVQAEKLQKTANPARKPAGKGKGKGKNSQNSRQHTSKPKPSPKKQKKESPENDSLRVSPDSSDESFRRDTVKKNDTLDSVKIEPLKKRRAPTQKATRSSDRLMANKSTGQNTSDSTAEPMSSPCTPRRRSPRTSSSSNVTFTEPTSDDEETSNPQPSKDAKKKIKRPVHSAPKNDKPLKRRKKSKADDQDTSDKTDDTESMDDDASHTYPAPRIVAATNVVPIYKCRGKYCKKKGHNFPNQQELYDHVKTCYKKKMWVCQYNDSCPRYFSQRSYRRDHVRVDHKGIPFVCEFCEEGKSKKYQTRRSLLFHVNYVHCKTTEAHCCEYCGKRFSTKQNLMRHLASHQDMRMFQCRMCSASFNYADGLAEHVNSCKSQIRLKCPYCPKTLKTRQILNTHVKRFHFDGKRKICLLCSKVYADVGAYKRHVEKHQQMTA